MPSHQIAQAFVDTQERMNPETMRDIDQRDHFARYRFASDFVRGRHVMDCASGRGYGVDMLMKAGAASVIGVEVEPEAVAASRLDYPAARFVCDSMITFQGGPFDVITSFETIEHIDRYEDALKNLRRLLAPGGTLILSTPNRPINDPRCRTLADRPSNPYHVREFNIEEMVSALRRAGFKSIERYGQKLRRPSAPTLLMAAEMFLRSGNRRGDVLPLRPGLEPRYMVMVAR